MDLEQLKRDFVSPDRDVWVEAARQLGRAAADSSDVLAFIKKCADDTTQVHRRRHAFTALAAYHSQREETPPLISAWEAAALTGLGKEACRADLVRIPTVAARFDSWRSKQLEQAQLELHRIEGSGAHEKAVASKRSKVASLEEDSQQARLPKGFFDGRRPKGADPWDIASYLLGAESPKAFADIPIDLITRGLCVWAEDLGFSGLALTLNLPELLGRTELPNQEAAKAALRSLDHSRFSDERLHHSRFVQELADVTDQQFVPTWIKGQHLPPWLGESLAALSNARGGLRARAAARLCRVIIDRCFGDDWRFRELESGERFALNVFLLLVERGTVPFGGSSKELSRPHRVALLLEGLQASHRAREQVLPALVRVLRQLLSEELGKAADRDVAAVALRHIALVRPLLTEWKLPGTIRKDLASVIGSALQAVLSRAKSEFFRVWYALLFDFPDEVIFREMIEYCADERLSELMQSVLRVFSADDAMQAYANYVEALRAVDDESRGLKVLVEILGRADLSADLGTQQARDLVSIMTAREQPGAWRDLAAPPSRDRRGARFEAEEHQRNQLRQARLRADNVQHALDEVKVLESECLPEVGRPTPRDDLVRDWRRLIRAQDELASRCGQHLPCVEAQAVGALLESRTQVVEDRLDRLVRVLEREDEAYACEVIESRLATGDEDASDEDERLVEEWMLSRYMVAELARTHRLSVLGWLTNPWFVFFWFLAPHVVCAVLHNAGLLAYRGLPYAVASATGVLLLWAYFSEAKSARALTAGAGRFLLPQTSAALFIGLMEVVSADESWSMAVLEYSWVRLFKIAAFVVMGFFFIREVLLAGQLAGRDERGQKSRRAAAVMSLVLWQAALGVLVFGILFGRIMGARAELGPEIASLTDSLGVWLPAEVHLGPRFFDLPSASEPPAYRIFPWALLTWTVQVFFLSAIFERIMSRKA